MSMSKYDFALDMETDNSVSQILRNTAPIPMFWKSAALTGG